MGSLQISVVFFTEGLFGVLPLTYARAYLFPQSVKIPYFCSGPISVDPICPQRMEADTSTQPTLDKDSRLSAPSCLPSSVLLAAFVCSLFTFAQHKSSHRVLTTGASLCFIFKARSTRSSSAFPHKVSA